MDLGIDFWGIDMMKKHRGIYSFVSWKSEKDTN